MARSVPLSRLPEHSVPYFLHPRLQISAAEIAVETDPLREKFERPARSWIGTGINNTSTCFSAERGSPNIVRPGSSLPIDRPNRGGLCQRNPNRRKPKFLWGRGGVAGWGIGNRWWKIMPAPLFDLDIPRQICHNLHQMRNLDAPHCATKPVSRRYSASDGLRVKDDANTLKLRIDRKSVV